MGINVKIQIPDRVRCDTNVAKSRTKYVCYKENKVFGGGDDLMGMFDSLIVQRDSILMNDEGTSIVIEPNPEVTGAMYCDGEIGGTLFCTVAGTKIRPMGSPDEPTTSFGV